MRRFGYSFRGCPAQSQRWYGNWGPRITAIPVICSEGIIELNIRRGTTDEESFLAFVNEKLIPNLQRFDGINSRSVVVMDNAAIHRCRRVVEAINTTGALIVFLPAYSPDFNPCENIFSQAKSWIRANDVVWQVCHDPEEMVFEAFMQVSDVDIRNYLRFIGYL
ncbi:uncharacterized protein LOC116306156 [Actinia tenebrosa]|uniref:Uncharacterized protein LOC116306156 n=1 Tax=Actinia tenebrosa TaxID=6105 RepID=A0A6P8IY24_ACTTE|nr:uncharacterized protein LOC116306156 [Actinia tenebrosa]